jgi:hypothetical protein
MADVTGESHHDALSHDLTTGELKVQGVTDALQELEGKGLIRASRGKISILDRQGLESAADGCYGAPEAEYRRLMAEPSCRVVCQAGVSLERRAALRRLIEPDPRSPVQFSDHVDCDGAKFFKAAAELGLEGIVSKRPASRYRSGPSRSWLKTKNMVESEFILLGTERDSDGVPWALLASDRDGRLEFAGPAILNPCQQERGKWSELMAALAVAKPPLRGLRQGTAQWLRPELRVRVEHLKAEGTLRHATVKHLITSSDA